MKGGFNKKGTAREPIEQEILYSATASKSAKRMVLSVMLLKEGIKPDVISRFAGVSARQVRNYGIKYEKQGVSALTNSTRYKPASELEAYKDLIRESLLANPVATAAEASERIEKLTGIKRCPTQVRQFMRKLGLKPIKVAAIPAKANPEAQAKFLSNELEPRIEEAKAGKRVLLFMDAAHFVWQLYLGVLWCLARIFISAASGRTRINVLGAYDPIKNMLHKIVNREYINSRTVIDLLERLRAIYSDKIITVVLDTARYQRCKVVMEAAARLHIELLFLPTYSPNLNLIERLWRFVKKDCLYSKYYETANDFESSIVNCLDDINFGKKPKLKKLMTLKFQLFPKSQSDSSVPQNLAA